MQRYAVRAVLLAGCASGTGRATVHRLVEEGATVLAVDVAAAGLADTAAGASRPGAGATLTGEVTDPDLAPAAVAAAIAYLGSEGATHVDGADLRVDGATHA